MKAVEDRAKATDERTKAIEERAMSTATGVMEYKDYVNFVNDTTEVRKGAYFFRFNDAIIWLVKPI